MSPYGQTKQMHYAYVKTKHHRYHHVLRLQQRSQYGQGSFCYFAAFFNMKMFSTVSC